MASFTQRARRKLGIYLQGRLKCLDLALPLVEEKAGLEIGGPSTVFQPGWSREYGWSSPLPIYDRVASLDNCNFSRQTLWSTHGDTFCFSPRKPLGRVVIAEGSALHPLADRTYDFVLSSHNLEHFANPVKALLEWRRVTRPCGALILVLPDYRRTFDHRREPTPVVHMLKDYEVNLSEDDATHVPEVLELHDLMMDGTLKTHTWEELAARSRSNVANRVLHHHVFDEHNSTELLAKVGLDILAVELAKPHHIVFVGRWKSETIAPGIQDCRNMRRPENCAPQLASP